MSDAEIKLVFLAVGTGIFLMARAIKRRRTIRRIADSPRSRIESAPQGQVEVQGFAWPISEGFATPRGEEAIYYSLLVQKKVSKGSGKSRRTEWVTVASHRHAYPFYLVDATGLAIVEPGEADFEVGTKSTRSWSSVPRAEKDAVVRIVGARAGDGFPPGGGILGLFSGNYRIVETEILLGYPTYANGDFATTHTEALKVTSSGLAEFHRRVFHPATRGLRRIDHFLDKNRDGRISEEEARRGYHFAARTARRRPPTPSAAEAEFEVHGRLRSSATTRLLVGDCHEEHLKRRLGRWTEIQFLGGAGLITVGLLVALASFGVVASPFHALKEFFGDDGRRPTSVRGHR